jgi:uncharacterized membrane protein YfcA
MLLAGSLASGGVAAVTGFGIGSIMTPLWALQIGTKAAVAAVTIPHFVATFMRFWMVRKKVDRRAFIHFGLTSAIGGLIGALLHRGLESDILRRIFGSLLVFAGLMGFSGLSQKLRLNRTAAGIAGALSGIFGGLVGNQGGIRSGALMTFNLSKESLVATSTAVGLIVDGARLPVYLISDGPGLFALRIEILLCIFGVAMGTLVGIRFLRKLPESGFRKILSLTIFLLGIYTLVQGAA